MDTTYFTTADHRMKLTAVLCYSRPQVPSMDIMVVILFSRILFSKIMQNASCQNSHAPADILPLLGQISALLSLINTL